MSIVCNFSEYEHYDIQYDKRVLTLVATTGEGSWFAPLAMESASGVRAARKAFREYVLECLGRGDLPHEVELAVCAPNVIAVPAYSAIDAHSN